MEALIFGATWDNEAEVWWISETPIPGLITEASTLDELYQKLVVMIPEMLEGETPEEEENFQPFDNTEKFKELRSRLKTGSLPIQVTSFRECAITA